MSQDSYDDVEVGLQPSGHRCVVTRSVDPSPPVLGSITKYLRAIGSTGEPWASLV